MTDSELLEMLEDRFWSLCLSHAVDLADAIGDGEVEGYPEALDWIASSIDGSSDVIYYGQSLLAIAGADPHDVSDAVCNEAHDRTGCGNALGIVAYRAIESRVLAFCAELLSALAERDAEAIASEAVSLRDRLSVFRRRMGERWGFRDE